jgi:hypothetical protein
MTTNKTAKIEVENINHPGSIRSVDAATYAAMKRAWLKVLPKSSPGLTAVEIRQSLISLLPEDLFPDGAGAGWWSKTVQLDLEAKGIIRRETTSPLRWRKT